MMRFLGDRGGWWFLRGVVVADNRRSRWPLTSWIAILLSRHDNNIPIPTSILKIDYGDVDNPADWTNCFVEAFSFPGGWTSLLMTGGRKRSYKESPARMCGPWECDDGESWGDPCSYPCCPLTMYMVWRVVQYKAAAGVAKAVVAIGWTYLQWISFSRRAWPQNWHCASTSSSNSRSNDDNNISVAMKTNISTLEESIPKEKKPQWVRNEFRKRNYSCNMHGFFFHGMNVFCLHSHMVSMLPICLIGRYDYWSWNDWYDALCWSWSSQRIIKT